VGNGQSKASTNDNGDEENRSSADSGDSQIPVSAAPQPSGSIPMHRLLPDTWGSRSSLLLQGSCSRLVTDKLLCQPCEKVANDVANEIAEQKLGLLQRARSLRPPSVAPPEPPELKPVPGYHSAAPASLSPSHRATLISPNRHSRGSFRGSQRVLLPGQTQLGDDEFYFPYSCEWDAGPVHMKDIMEDGMPPDQRASDVEHLRLSITVKSANHLPKADAGFGKCDPYIELRFFDQKFRTKTHNMTYDAFFEETFSLFVHAENVKQAALETDADRAAAMGLAVELECFDFDLFGANDSIGTMTLLLKDLLDQTQDFGSEITLERNLKRHGQTAFGADGKQTSITISCKRVELDAKRPRLGVVTLESCLAQSDGALAIVCSRQTLSFGDESASQYVGVGAKTVKARFRRSSSFFSESFFKQNKEKDKTTASGKKSAVTQSLQAEDEEDKKIPDDDIYWREWLETFLESLTINILVMLLVLIDVINIVVTLLSNSLEETETQTQITYFVLACFVVELSTRMLAQGRRFFQNYWNIFDVIVIYASIAFSAAQYYIAQAKSRDGIEDARQATTSLRILSRIAMALRMIRVISHARKLAKLKGTVSRGLRAAVSQNKRRFVRNGFDLDLTYITDRIIAMSAPALGEHKAYRNDGHVVSRFLSLRHYGSFFIFNLCDTCLSSDGVIGNYHPQMFFNQVQRIPFEDHGPPLLLELIHFCREATKWLRRDAANIMAVHCKGGKGRTGIMIAVTCLFK
jgi:predicted nucleic acid-binding protein